MNKTIEYFLGLDWRPVIDTVTEEEDTYVRLQIPGFADFAVYGDSVSDVKQRWLEAFTSHLDGYLRVGKVIPEPVQLQELVDGPADRTASNVPADGNRIEDVELVA